MTAAAGEAKLVTAPLLCCICQDQNTTLRYEVTYSQHQDRSLTILDVTRAEELRPLTEDSSEQETAEAEYYNFPLKHPRHGHLNLKWPVSAVWRPNKGGREDSGEASTSVTSVTSADYPDYPVHIPTFTLQRITSLLASRGSRGNTRGEHSTLNTYKNSFLMPL